MRILKIFVCGVPWGLVFLIAASVSIYAIDSWFFSDLMNDKAVVFLLAYHFGMSCCAAFVFVCITGLILSEGSYRSAAYWALASGGLQMILNVNQVVTYLPDEVTYQTRVGVVRDFAFTNGPELFYGIGMLALGWYLFRLSRGPMGNATAPATDPHAWPPAPSAEPVEGFRGSSDG